MIDVNRRPNHPPFVRVAVGVDPAVTSNEKSDETGIIVAGLAQDGEYYIVNDRSLVGTPSEWALEVVAAYQYHMADIIVGEVNQGGDLVETNIKNVDRNVNYLGVRATRGKLLRAEPIAGLYEMGKVHHVDYLPELEDQMISWAPGDKSPDRMDGLVYAIYALMDEEISGIQPNHPCSTGHNRLHPSLAPQISFTRKNRPPSFGGGRR
jgi:phage terminase large subunit-like protein